MMALDANDIARSHGVDGLRLAWDASHADQGAAILEDTLPSSAASSPTPQSTRISPTPYGRSTRT